MLDILSLVEQSGTGLKRVASTKGGEFAGPCPVCGGEDRFRCWPNAERPGWFCRGCDRGGDAVSFVMHVKRIGYREACRKLGLTPGSRSATSTPQPPESADDNPPSVLWQERAQDFVAWAEQQLWSAAGAPVLAYLHRYRGLSDDTIRTAHVGLNPSDLYEAPARWGIESDRKVWMPTGIVIPCFAAGSLWYARVRRPLSDDQHGNHDALSDYLPPVAFGREQKYVHVKGSRPKSALFGVDSLPDHDIAVLTEGEFDALLLEQVAGDLVGVATLGSASATLTPRWFGSLLRLRRILVAGDTDVAGQAGAAKLAALSARCRMIKPLRKDVTAMMLAGDDVRAWLHFQLRKHTPLPSTAKATGAAHAGEPASTLRPLTETTPPAPTAATIEPRPRECYSCFGREFWLRPDGSEWVCSRCHPNPAAFSSSEVSTAA
jgi:hypothetical protein